MDIFEVDKILLFAMVFGPGFISLKVHDLLIPTDRRDFGSAFIEAIGYSFVNFGLLIWLIVLIHSGSFYANYPVLYSFALVLIFLVFPIAWPFILIRVRRLFHLEHPIKRPWDFIFAKKIPYWVIIHLKNGLRIGGKYGDASFASSYPAQEQLFIEEMWRLDDKQRFVEAVDRSAGAMFFRDEILMIEFFEDTNE